MHVVSMEKVGRKGGSGRKKNACLFLFFLRFPPPEKTLHFLAYDIRIDVLFLFLKLLSGILNPF